MRRSLLCGARAAGLVIALAAGAGACASNGTAGVGGSGSPTSPNTASPTNTATAPSSGASNTAAGAHALAECSAANLTITGQDSGAGAGHEGLLLVFKNTGSAACFMQGYPGAALKLPGGGTLNAQRTMSGYLGGDEVDQSPPYVTVASGATVSALLEWSDVTVGSGAMSSANCSGYGATGLLVTAPDQTVSTSMAASQYVCNGFEIHPVIPIVANALQPSAAA
jgi:hypothetical protein